MLETMAIVVVVVVVLIAGLLGFAASKPATFRVQRATSINATPEKIFALVNDLRSHGLWSPWEKKDPAMKRTYSGAASGESLLQYMDRMIGREFETGLANLKTITEGGE